MTCIDAVATLFNQLDNVITEFRLYNLGYFLRILQAECHIRIRRVHHTTSHESAFATFDGRCFVFGIQTSQRREVDFPFRHTVGIVTQPFLHIFNFRNRNFRLQSDNLHLHLRRDVRDTVLRKVFEVTAYFCRSHLDFPNQFLLHLLHRQSVTCIVAQCLTNLCRGFIEVFFHLFFRTNLLDIHIGHHIYTLYDFRFGNFDTIQLCLVQEQLLHGNFFRNHAIRVAVESASVIQGIHTCLFYI